MPKINKIKTELKAGARTEGDRASALPSTDGRTEQSGNSNESTCPAPKPTVNEWKWIWMKKKLRIILIGNIKSASEGFTLNLPSARLHWRLSVQTVAVSAVQLARRQRNRKADNSKWLCSSSSTRSSSDFRHGRELMVKFSRAISMANSEKQFSVVSAQFHRTPFQRGPKKVEKS